MDNHPPKDDPKNTSDSPGPRVIDLSRRPSGQKDFFHKKAFLGGLIAVILLGVVGLALGFYYIRQRITVPPQASEAELEALEEADAGSGFVDPQQPLSEEEGDIGECTNDKKIKQGIKINIPSEVTLDLSKGNTHVVDVVYVNRYEKKLHEVISKPLLTSSDSGKLPPPDKQFIESIAIEPPTVAKIPKKEDGDKKNRAKLKYTLTLKPNTPSGSTTQFKIWTHGWVYERNKKGVRKKKFCVTGDKTITVKFTRPAQQAVCTSLTLDKTTGPKPLTVNATLVGNVTGGDGTGTIAKYHFNWGDGQTSGDQTQASLSHTYSVVGSYTIVGTVIDNLGTRATTNECQKLLTVTEPPSYKYGVCEGEACVQKDCPIPGVNCNEQSECQVASDCKIYQKKICEDSACKVKNCPNRGVNCNNESNCSSNADCAPPKIYRHKVCLNSACKEVECSPNTSPCSDECSSDSACRRTVVPPPPAPPPPAPTPPPPATYQHKVCQNNACVSVLCSPSTSPCANECASNTDCQAVVVPPPSTPTHKECRNNACVAVPGAGSDQCTSVVSCRPASTTPPIPPSGNAVLTIGGILLGVGALIAGLILAF